MNRYIIDVREPREYAAGHVENAVNIPMSEIAGGTKKLDAIPRDAEVILYCMSGGRAGMSKKILESLGYTNVVNGISKDHVLAQYGS